MYIYIQVIHSRPGHRELLGGWVREEGTEQGVTLLILDTDGFTREASGGAYTCQRGEEMERPRLSTEK